uniref:Uncharacterized protein n=1 Tax=Cucumis melo TaxID=3656 RepID=A0A9I9DMZ8_CUCME
MALAVSNIFHCPKLRLSQRQFHSKFSVLQLRSSSIRLREISRERRMVICSAASAAGSSNPDSDFNPYEVLGVNPIEGFDMVKAAYTKKRREAERIGDEATAARLEKAYDKVMMAQFTNRKKGVTFGSVKVSKDIKYADNQPIVPWGPRSSKSSPKDMQINMAISAVFTAWVLIKRAAEYKPLQFLAFVFVYRIFEKLKTQDLQNLIFFNSFFVVISIIFCFSFSCSVIILVNFLQAYTGVLNFIEFMGGYIPVFLYNNQELLVTSSSALMLYIMASYYR